MTKWIWAFRLTLLLAMCVIYVYAIWPSSSHGLDLFDWDKLNHAAAFFTLALLSNAAFPRRPFDGWAASILFSSLLGYGLLIEVTQYFVPGRTFSGWDMLADAFGILLFFIGLLVTRSLGVAWGCLLCLPSSAQKNRAGDC